MSESTFLYNGEVELKFHKGWHAYYLVGPDGKAQHVPGVTTILGCIDKSGPLTFWAARMATLYIRERIKYPVTERQLEALLFWAELNFQKVKERAADIGSMIHDYCHEWAKYQIQGGTEPAYPVDPYTHYGCDAFHEWVEQHDVTFLFIETEQKVYSRQHDYCGTFDFIARIDGELAIGDYKTSPHIYDEFGYQLAAYKYAKEEENHYEWAWNPENKGYSVTELPNYARWIIRLGKMDGDFEAVKLDPDTYMDDFNTFLAAKIIYWRRKQQEKEKKELFLCH